MTAPGTRWARIHAGDSLRRIALRELGDALRWIDLATLNQLRPPYLIASVDPADRQPATLVWGDPIAIPLGAVTETVPPVEDVLGTDVALSQGQLTATADGDWATVAGAANLGQALAHRLKTPTGELLAHPAYGCDMATVLGLRNRQAMQAVLIYYVRRAIAQEPRVARTTWVKTSALADQVHVEAQIAAVVHNTTTDLNLVFPLS